LKGCSRSEEEILDLVKNETRDTDEVVVTIRHMLLSIPLASMVNPFNDANTDFEMISNIGTFGDLEVHRIVENIRTSNYV
jgi:predicted transport protein